MNYYVYFIREQYRGYVFLDIEGNGIPSKTVRRKMKKMPVKVGVSNNPDRRMITMQTGNSRKLELIAKMGPFSKKQAFSQESRIHRILGRGRITGEWFDGLTIHQYLQDWTRNFPND